MAKGIFLLSSGASSSQPIISIGRGLQKYSKHSIELVEYGRDLSVEELQKIDSVDFFISYHWHNFDAILKKTSTKILGLVTTVEETNKSFFQELESRGVQMLAFSRYAHYWYNQLDLKGTYVGVGVDLDLFPLREIPSIRPPIFGMAFNTGVYRRKGTQILSHLKNCGIDVKCAIGNIAGKPNFENDKMYNFYHSIDCLLFNSPDSRGRETGGMPVLEAGACGLPIISTKVGFACDTIENGIDGFFVESDEEIYALCKKFQDNRDLIDIGMKYSEKIRSRFSWNVIAKNWDSVIDSISN